MITYEQALNADFFHYEPSEKRTVGPRGGVKEHVEVWRRNGKTKTWKTRPNEFSIPVKYGLKSCGYITHYDSHQFHIEAECSLRQQYPVHERE